jgi:hypothetical protein
MRTFGTIDSSSNLIHMLQRCGLFSPLNIPNRPRLGMYVLSCIVMYCLRLKSSTSSLAFAYPAGPLCKTSEAPYCTSFLWNVNPFKKREITPCETFDSGPAKQIGEFFKMSQIRLTSNISGCPTLIYPIWGCYTFSL